MSPAQSAQLVYAGFWRRMFATLFDSVLLLLVVCPTLIFVHGWGLVLIRANPPGPLEVGLALMATLAVMLFWIYKGATPGKMLVGVRIVDARTGAPASKTQLVARYIAYYVSMLAVGMGFFVIAQDPHKQGWHDKIARTAVVRRRLAKPRVASAPVPVSALDY